MKSNLFALIFVTLSVNSTVFAQVNEPVHYAYANYLGSGIYRTTGQNASLLSMNFSHELGKKNKTSFGLRLPVSVGFFDFDVSDIPELNLPSEVGTITFTPGLSFDYQHSSQLSFESYVDLGYARNFSTNRGVNIQSFGVSALYEFDLHNYDSIWANRVYYAAYSGNGYDTNDAYAAIQLGIDTGLPLKYSLFGRTFQPRVFATAFWYFSEVTFFIPLTKLTDENNTITLTNSLEVGLTLKLDKKIGVSWASIDRLGLSYRFSQDFSAFRVLFSFPI